MRKITVLSMMSLDGVIQAPGGPEEDRSGGFEFGGWTAPYADADFGQAMQKELQTADYLLGRKTFDIWEHYWPHHGDFWPGINEGNKYVFSQTRNRSDWEKTVFIRTAADIEKLKRSEGRDIQVWGSSELIHLLLEHDLIDELRLKTYPVILGKGKKLFDGKGMPGAFSLLDSTATTKGVVLSNYVRDGKVKTGNVAV